MNQYFESCQELLKVHCHPAIGIFGYDQGTAEDARGIICREDCLVESNNCLFELPFDSIMSTASLPQSTLFKTALQYLTETTALREDDQLALLLLHEKFMVKDNSKWATHIAVLPEKYYSIPNWTFEQLQMIQGCNLYTIGGHWQIQLKNDFADLCQTELLLPSSATRTTLGKMFEVWLTYESYIWALSTIVSRFISITIPSTGAVLRGMVPVVDLMNHSPTSRVGHIYSEPDGMFRVISQQSWRAGDEIYLNYGHVSNERLVMLYGFALPDNPYSAVNIYASMDPSALAAKKDALRQMGIPAGLSVPFPVDAKALPVELLTFLRVQHATPTEIEQMACLQSGTKPLSNETELKACHALRQVLSGMLAGYPQTAVEDEQLLIMQGAQGYIECLATTLRLSEKKVLTSAISLVHNYEESLRAV